MRILAFNYEYPPLGGGGGVVHQQMVDVLARRHQVTVITSAFKGLERHEFRSGVEIHRVPVLMRTKLATATLPSLLSYYPSSLRFGRKLLGSQRFDIINSHFAVPSAPSAQKLATRFGLPHVLSAHGGDLYDPSKRLSPHRVPLLRGVVRRMLLKADRVVAQSSNTADNARNYYGVYRDIDIIPLGIRRPEFQPATRAEMGIPAERLVIATVGRLVRRKCLDDLLRAVARLNNPRHLLLVMGDGPMRGEWESLARTLGIAGQVRFLGAVSEADKWRYLSVSDIFASTSMHEGFGLVFLEAMHCGLPVIACDFGGQTDFLQHGRTGALVGVNCVEQFAAAIHELDESEELRKSCGAYNRERVSEFYIERCAERYERLFEEVLRARHDAAQPALRPAPATMAALSERQALLRDLKARHGAMEKARGNGKPRSPYRANGNHRNPKIRVQPGQPVVPDYPRPPRQEK